MILHLSPDAPWIARAAADAALVGHIGGGTLGVAAGLTALVAPKGGRLHRAAGNVFFVSMLIGFGVGAIVAPLIHEPRNALGAAFAGYLVATGWATVKRPQGQAGRFAVGAAIAMVAAVLLLAALAAMSAGELSSSASWPAFIVPLVVFALVARFDLKRILNVAGAARIRRHLWRMCVGLFIGTGSLFIGQPQVFPPPLHGSPILWIIGFAPLILMIFWLVRMRPGHGGSPAAIATPTHEVLT